MSTANEIEQKCSWCRLPFTASNGREFCSDECRRARAARKPRKKYRLLRNQWNRKDRAPVATATVKVERQLHWRLRTLAFERCTTLQDLIHDMLTRALAKEARIKAEDTPV